MANKKGVQTSRRFLVVTSERLWAVQTKLLANENGLVDDLADAGMTGLIPNYDHAKPARGTVGVLLSN